MITYLTCPAAQGMLDAFVDDELAVADQVALDGHLRWCDTCRARVEDMRVVGAAMRMRSAAVAWSAEDDAALTAMRAELLERVRLERDESWPARARAMATDMRFLWPALGATAALVLCVSALTGVSNILRGVRPDSMAALISMLANPGSDENPLVLNGRMQAPRTLDVSPALVALCEDDVAFTVAAVVTREGRVSNYELVSRAERTAAREGARPRDDFSVVSDAVRQSRFAPAQTSDGAVAVNMVWLLARTTVKAPVTPGEIGALPPLDPPPAASEEKSLNARLPRGLRPARS